MNFLNSVEFLSHACLFMAGILSGAPIGYWLGSRQPRKRPVYIQYVTSEDIEGMDLRGKGAE